MTDIYHVQKLALLEKIQTIIIYLPLKIYNGQKNILVITF